MSLFRRKWGEVRQGLRSRGQRSGNYGPEGTLDSTATVPGEKQAVVNDGNGGIYEGEPEADRIVEPGTLNFDEDTSGGLGRHLGLFSTTFLICNTY